MTDWAGVASCHEGVASVTAFNSIAITLCWGDSLSVASFIHNATHSLGYQYLLWDRQIRLTGLRLQSIGKNEPCATLVTRTKNKLTRLQNETHRHGVWHSLYRDNALLRHFTLFSCTLPRQSKPCHCHINRMHATDWATCSGDPW